MEHPCSHCGALVEDGQPFCPQCRAPQIKVQLRCPAAPLAESAPPPPDEPLPPPQEPIAPNDSSAVGTPPPPQPPPEGSLIWRPALGSALVAGMLAAVGTSIPVIPLAMLCMFASGGLAVTLYRRRAGFQRVTPVMGAKLGILAGGLGFGVLSILSGVRLIASSERDELRVAFQQKMQDAMSTSADPQVRQAMEEFRNYIATDHGLILMVLLFLAIAAVVFLVFAALGGVLGAVLFGRDGARRQP